MLGACPHCLHAMALGKVHWDRGGAANQVHIFGSDVSLPIMACQHGQLTHMTEGSLCNALAGGKTQLVVRQDPTS